MTMNALRMRARGLLNIPLTAFIGPMQRRTMLQILQGEEGDWMAQVVIDLFDRIQAMPMTYQQDGLGENAIVYLKYFGGADVWVTERDKSSDLMKPDDQEQAFGAVNLGYGPELGYIHLPEIIGVPSMEIDLYWTPKTLREAKAI